MPDFYDIVTDGTREVTQDDVDRWQRVITAFGLLVTFLRKTGHGTAASIAVDYAQSLTTSTEATARFYDLLPEHTA